MKPETELKRLRKRKDDLIQEKKMMKKDINAMTKEIGEINLRMKEILEG